MWERFGLLHIYARARLVYPGAQNHCWPPKNLDDSANPSEDTDPNTSTSSAGNESVYLTRWETAACAMRIKNTKRTAEVVKKTRYFPRSAVICTDKHIRWNPRIKAWSRLKGLAEELGFEPTARSSSSVVVRARPPRAQKVHRVSAEIRRDTVSSAGSAVNSDSVGEFGYRKPSLTHHLCCSTFFCAPAQNTWAPIPRSTRPRQQMD
jgi:hypothetical protein